MTRFQSSSRISFASFAVVAAAVALALAGCGRGDSGGGANQTPVDQAAQAAVMQKGLDLLYKVNDPMAAADTFRSLLKLNPTHYGARYQLAKSLDLSGKPEEARPLWTSVLETAQAINDTVTMGFVKNRLAQPDTLSQVAMMVVGLDLLYKKGDPAGATEQFKKLLARNPKHYGGIFQLAKALDQAGKPDEARVYWEKSLRAAESIHDQPTMDVARARLQAKQ